MKGAIYAARNSSEPDWHMTASSSKLQMYKCCLQNTAGLPATQSQLSSYPPQLPSCSVQCSQQTGPSILCLRMLWLCREKCRKQNTHRNLAGVTASCEVMTPNRQACWEGACRLLLILNFIFLQALSFSKCFAVERNMQLITYKVKHCAWRLLQTCLLGRPADSHQRRLSEEITRDCLHPTWDRCLNRN